MNVNVMASGGRLPRGNARWDVSFYIHNASTLRVDTSVLLFISDLVRSVAPPVRELEWFRSVPLAVRSRRKVTIRITAEMLSFIKEQHRVVEPRQFECHFKSWPRSRATIYNHIH